MEVAKLQKVAYNLDRHFLGIDIKQEYVDLAKKRIIERGTSYKT